jgi:mono/diheme cytochrome c family protein
VCFGFVAIGVAILIFASSLMGQQPSRTSEATPVTGESWLTHLQRPFNATNMGKTGYLGPSPSDSDNESAQSSPMLSVHGLDHSVSLGGADIYRLNCRGCHGEQGQGSPPEIHSVINPVRAGSAALVIERMKSSGMDISHAQAVQMAAQARTAISERLHNGGESMPPFSYLKDAEARSLNGYLYQLAGVAGQRASTIEESPLRVGELIVKSTCHICHDATGANPTPEQILQGAIPPLATLTKRTNQIEFVRKVTRGAPILMGTPAMLQRGRMPVFYYLTPDEAADVYSYLTLYPPRLGQQNSISPPDERQLVAMVTASDSLPAEARPAIEAIDGKSILLIMGLGALVMLFIAIGIAITVREFMRLAPRNVAQQGRQELVLGQAQPSEMPVYSK